MACHKETYLIYSIQIFFTYFVLQTTYIQDVKEAPAVKSYRLAAETHAKFIESKVKGDANYNMLDSSAVCCMRPRKKQT